MTPPMRDAWQSRRKQVQPAGTVSGGCLFLMRLGPPLKAVAEVVGELLVGSNILGAAAAAIGSEMDGDSFISVLQNLSRRLLRNRSGIRCRWLISVLNLTCDFGNQ